MNTAKKLKLSAEDKARAREILSAAIEIKKQLDAKMSELEKWHLEQVNCQTDIVEFDDRSQEYLDEVDNFAFTYQDKGSIMLFFDKKLVKFLLKK